MISRNLLLIAISVHYSLQSMFGLIILSGDAFLSAIIFSNHRKNASADAGFFFLLYLVISFQPLVHRTQTIFQKAFSRSNSSNLFLKQKINVVDSEGYELVIWAIDVEEKSAKRHKNGPGKKKERDLVSLRIAENCLAPAPPGEWGNKKCVCQTYIFPEVEPSSKR